MATEIPTKLIEHIFSFVDQNDKKTCASVCATNKLGQRVVTPLMYQSVGTATSDGDHMELDHSRQLELLCRTLMENRKLAGHVEELQFYIDQDTLKNKRRDIPLTVSACSRFLKAHMDLPDSVAESICKSFLAMGPLSMENADDPSVTEMLRRTVEAHSHDIGERNSAAALLAPDEAYMLMMLTICDRIRLLTLVGDLSVVSHMSYLWQTVGNVHLDHGDNALRPSQGKGESRSYNAGIYTVSQISLEHSSTTHGDLVLRDLWIFLQLPSIQSLRADGVSASPSDMGGYAIIFGSAIRTLELNCCFAKTEEIASFISTCPSLRKLHVQFGMKEDAHRRLDWRDLGTALRDHCPLLEVLVIDHAHDHIMDDEDFYHSAFGDMDNATMLNTSLRGLGTLSELEHLTELTITFRSRTETYAR